MSKFLANQAIHVSPILFGHPIEVSEDTRPQSQWSSALPGGRSDAEIPCPRLFLHPRAYTHLAGRWARQNSVFLDAGPWVSPGPTDSGRQGTRLRSARVRGPFWPRELRTRRVADPAAVRAWTGKSSPCAVSRGRSSCGPLLQVRGPIAYVERARENVDATYLHHACPAVCRRSRVWACRGPP